MPDTHFWYMTVQTPLPRGGFSVTTRHGTLTPGTKDTRSVLFVQILNMIDPNAQVLTFDLQPNKI